MDKLARALLEQIGGTQAAEGASKFESKLEAMAAGASPRSGVTRGSTGHIPQFALFLAGHVLAVVLVVCNGTSMLALTATGGREGRRRGGVEDETLLRE